MYNYLLSVIMPVYNSALYLDEAILSIINQSLGFEKIQLILVNDGSTDESAEIIKKYAIKHQNIVFVDKKNGGVSSARNEGLKYADGKYITFPDPDDTVSANTYRDAISFFEANFEKTSVVSFPIYFCGDARGEHPLNEKFKNGSRIIDLERENEFQLHITSSIIKAEIAKKMHFKESLVVSEDAEALLRVLIDTPALGVVDTGSYSYRKREGSLLDHVGNKREWYKAHLEEYFMSVINYARERLDKVPAFVQGALAYDLSWKLSQREAPNCLTEDEIKEFKTLFSSLLNEIDDEIIEKISHLPVSTKQYLVSLKGKMINGEEYPYTLEFIDTCDDKIKINARLEYPTSAQAPSGALVYVNGKRIDGALFIEPKTTFLGDTIISCALIEIQIPRAELDGRATVYFAHENSDTESLTSALEFGKFFPLEKTYKSSFSQLDDFIITHDDNALIFEALSKRTLKKYDKAFIKELWKSNAFAERKAVIARTLAKIYKAFLKRPLWIISDRLSIAKDNAEALFEHLSKTKFKGAKYVFAINRGDDFSRLKKYGRVVDRASMKYKIMHLCADAIISSHAEDFVTNPFDYYGKPYKDILSKIPFVFLQHGVTKDDLSSWLDKYNKRIRGFVCSSKREYDSILHTFPYHYTENELWLTGMARFDKLHSIPEKIITIAPTWRRYLVTDINIATGKWKRSLSAQNSEYLDFWNSLINDKRLLEALEKHDYKILFVPHPNLGDIAEFIDTSERVKIEAKPNYEKIYEKSSLLITDYSSLAFDMAYLEKPIIYAQFDKERFFSGEHTYKRGYYDYERDGFGKVTYTLDEAVQAVVQCIENNCALDSLYRERINSFFAYRDKNNSERIVQKLLEIGAKNDNSK